jgi:uncharacterized protein YwgA
MDAKDFVTLTLLIADGEIRGKTKLQKMVYFYGLMTSQLNELGYRAHFYGPYSDDVAGNFVRSGRSIRTSPTGATIARDSK